MPLIVIPYNRENAVEYAHKWAYSRNPSYYNFDAVGGDCTSFVSQCVFAGSLVMNYTRDVGWYYMSASNRSAAWSSVNYFHKFITKNKSAGPFGSQISKQELQIGDIVQLKLNEDYFQHSLMVVSIKDEKINVAAHTFDSDYRLLDTYDYVQIRFIHINGVRKYL